MADRHEGVVKSFSEKTGFGFITCPAVAAEYGGDVFLHQRQLGNCRVGEQVTFKLEINKSGKPQAFDVQSVNGNADFSSQAADPVVMRLPGVVLSVDSQSGFGFIQCPEVTETYGQDVFVAAQDMGSFQVGDQVSFVFFENEQDKPQGKELLAADALVSASGKQGVEDVASGWQGVIKSFAQKTGYGFIECADAKTLYGTDVFLVARDIGTCKVGDVVSFDLTVNNAQKPQASNLKLLQDGGGPPIAGKGKTKDSGDQYTGLRCTGVIKSYAQKSGYGFISCPDVTAQYGSDAFLMAADICSFGVGDHVTFDLIINMKGKPQGKNLASADGSGGSGGANGSFTGFKGNWGAKDGGGKGGLDSAGQNAGCMGGKEGGCWGGKDGYWGGMDGGWGGKDGCWMGGCWGGKDPFGWFGKGGCGWGPMAMDGCFWGGKDGFGWGGKDCWGGKDGGAWCGMDGKGKEGWGKDCMGGKGEKGFPCGKGYGKGEAPCGKACAKGEAPSAKKARIEYTFEDGGERYTGVVRSYTPSTGYGFIDCAEVKEKYGFDTYYKGVQLGGAGVGDKVEFSVKLTPDGKPQAENVKPV